MRKQFLIEYDISLVHLLIHDLLGIPVLHLLEQVLTLLVVGLPSFPLFVLLVGIEGFLLLLYLS